MQAGVGDLLHGDGNAPGIGFFGHVGRFCSWLKRLSALAKGISTIRPATPCRPVSRGPQAPPRHRRPADGPCRAARRSGCSCTRPAPAAPGPRSGRDRRPRHGRRTPPRRPCMRFGTVTSPTPISRKLASMSSQKRSNSACGQVRPGLDRLHPPQYHPQMQHQQIKTAVNRVRHAQVPIKQRFSRLRHDHAIDGLNGARRGHPGFPEVIERPKHCGFRKRAPKVCLLGIRACCNPACCPVRQRLARCKGTGPVPE